MLKPASIIYDSVSRLTPVSITVLSRFLIPHSVFKRSFHTTLFSLLTLATVTFLAFAPSAYALDSSINISNEDNKYIKSKEGCYVWQPSQPFGDTVSWTGSCEEGYAEGEGMAKWYNEEQLASIYTGRSIRGKLEGQGHIDWKIKNCCDLDYYEGKLKNSDPKQGTVYFTDGSIHSGEFVLDGMTAKGVKIFGKNSGYEGDRYEGEFVNSVMHGYGVYTWGANRPWSGDKYVGEFKNNSRHGHGVYISANGDRYEGEWKNGARSGEGTMVYADGTVYNGGWEDWWRSGYGEITFTNGINYKGYWKNDIADGSGIITYPNGIVYEGGVLNLERHGKGKTTYKKGTEQGTYVYGQRQGKFTHKSNDGGHMEVIYEGNKIVSGTQTRANGIVYSGAWRDGKALGYGHLTAPRSAFDPEKRAKNGVWKGDVYVEKGWFYDNKFKFPCDNHQHCIAVAKQHPEWQQYMD